MNELAGGVVLGRVVAEKAQIQKIGGTRQKFERREIALIQRAGVGPNPADAVLLEQTNDVRSMPARVPKFNRKSKTFWKLDEEFSQCLPAILGREGRRELNEYDVELGFKRLNRAQERADLFRAVAQSADVRDFTGKFAAETKRGWRLFDPASDRVLVRNMVKGRIDFHSRQIASVKLERLGIGQARGIEVSLPFRETPRAHADSDFLLVFEVQTRPNLC